MKKKILSVLLCTAMVASMAVGCGGKKSDSGSSSSDKLVYWSMWEATEPQGQAIQEAIDAYTKETGVEVDVQFKIGRAHV